MNQTVCLPLPTCRWISYICDVITYYDIKMPTKKSLVVLASFGLHFSTGSHCTFFCPSRGHISLRYVVIPVHHNVMVATTS